MKAIKKVRYDTCVLATHYLASEIDSIANVKQTTIPSFISQIKLGMRINGISDFNVILLLTLDFTDADACKKVIEEINAEHTNSILFISPDVSRFSKMDPEMREVEWKKASEKITILEDMGFFNMQPLISEAKITRIPIVYRTSLADLIFQIPRSNMLIADMIRKGKYDPKQCPKHIYS